MFHPINNPRLLSTVFVWCWFSQPRKMNQKKSRKKEWWVIDLCLLFLCFLFLLYLYHCSISHSSHLQTNSCRCPYIHTLIRDRRVLCNSWLFGNKNILHVHVSSSQNTWQRIVVPDSYLLASLLDERAAHLSDVSPPAYFPRLQSDFNAR